jgi:hypothetical protein
MVLLLDSDLPAVARLYATRAIARPIPDGFVVHRKWRYLAPSPPGELDEILAPTVTRWTDRYDDFRSPMHVLERLGKTFVDREVRGIPSDLAGLDLEIAITLDAVARSTWVDGNAVITTVSNEQGKPMLRVLPRGGAPALLIFTSTGDLEESRIPADGSRWIVQYRDFAGGAYGVCPTKMIKTRADLHKEMLLELVENKIEPVCDVSSVPTGPQWRWSGGLTKVEVPLSMSDDMPTVTLTLNGLAVRFILDTGTATSSIDTDLAKRLKLRVFGRLSWSRPEFTGRVGYAEMPETNVGGAQLEPHIVTVAPWQDTDLAAFGISGILGADAFATVIGVVDIPNGRLLIGQRSAFAPDASDVITPSRVISRQMFAGVTISGRSSEVLLDTGSPRTIVVRHIPGQSDLVAPDDRSRYDPAGAIGLNGSAGVWPAWGTIDIGPIHWRRVLMAVVDEASATGDALLRSGELGVGFFKHVRATFDFEGSRFWLSETTPYKGARCEYGIAVTEYPTSSDGGWEGKYVGRRFVVIAARGAAKRAGIMAGDEIVSVDGVNVMGAWPALACAPGRELVLGVRRIGKATRIVVTGAEIP